MFAGSNFAAIDNFFDAVPSWVFTSVACAFLTCSRYIKVAMPLRMPRIVMVINNSTIVKPWFDDPFAWRIRPAMCNALAAEPGPSRTARERSTTTPSSLISDLGAGVTAANDLCCAFLSTFLLDASV